MLVQCLQYFFVFSYVTPNNSFPPPLSPEEEKEIIERCKSGSEKEQREARNTLIVRNLRLVAHIVKRYSNHSKDTEDLLSIGDIGLIKAIETYQASKGTRFATYASRCINNTIII